MFAYLNKYHNPDLILDSSDQVIDQAEFKHQDWTSSNFNHISDKDYIPMNMHAPHGLGFAGMKRVDTDRSGDTVTRRSSIGFIIYVNSVPVYWISK